MTAESHNSMRRNQPAALWITLGMSLCLLLLVSGCSRPFWRQQAERDSYEAIAENLTDPRWAVPRIDVSADPRSRFYEAHDVDYAPLPPDDPHAHAYMHWVDGWNGYNCWHQFGDLLSVENPQWLLPFQMSPEHYDEETGEYFGPMPQIENLTLGEALELALIHNRDYQTEIENVFLAALVVTGERFRYSVRYLNSPGQTPGGSVLGSFMPQGGSDQVSMSAGAGIRQLLPTGGQWVLELANNTIWLFGGGNETATASTLSFALTQPLLRGAGRKVVLESLTQAERNLLYAVRELARFRRVFFTDVVGGPNGYLSLLGQLQAIRNSESNIFRLEEQVEALQEVSQQRPAAIREPLEQLPDGLVFPESLDESIEFDEARKELIWFGPITPEQVEQLKALSDDPAYLRAISEIDQRLTTQTVDLNVLNLQSDLANSINRLRGQQQGLQDRLDSFKVLLGLPPDFLITVDDSLLDQFQFIDQQLIDLELEITDFIPFWGQLDEDEPDREMFRLVAERFQVLQQRATNIGLSLVREDFERLQQIYEERMQKLESDAARARLEYDVVRDRRLFDDAVFILEDIAVIANRIAERSQDARVPIDDVKDWVFELKGAQEDLIKTVQSLQAIQIGLRVELVDMVPYDLSMEESVRTALENRLDLMNARAVVMDARRQIEVTANALKSVLDLEFAAEFRTPPISGFNTKPFDFRGDLSDFNVGLSLDTPIDQIEERNVYRQALVNYQRTRRAYMIFEDDVKRVVRGLWRQLEVSRLNLETSRQALRIAVARFDNAVEQAFEPPRVGQQVARGTGLQGQQIQEALNSILNAQNSLIDIWVSYEQARLNIYQEMGIMDVGPDNIWNDPFYREQTATERSDGAFPEEFPVDGVPPLTELEEGDSLRPGSEYPVGVANGEPPQENQTRTGLPADERIPSTKQSLKILGPLR